ncbi:putative dehydratase, MaoC family protein [Sphingobium herbicidovorans NBRC 16415]|uniref:Dehydratase, MaoC family protein n=1 Tax=Sphingobium herbicidovorans (strain ATCC 700291 / DSM 11019 / CCUG 56400 / KCTC 2939 / LMG 18315 / NBRC 16415 / MH) TaxID=1219045 RepID=A0A086PC28_SPHHM|nr:MaoC family dehydratase [Sphingobium herbicidovorans]KFG90946.1 putative dehydratase, MaoC family protein [Sphingobium herbicidovorans NBRC 16415]
MPGLYFEDFVVGKTYRHMTSRSVTDYDNIWMACMTHNTQPLHINFDFSEKQGLHGKPLFNSVYTMLILIGQASQELTRGTLVETALVTDIEFPRSVFAGDTLYTETEVRSLEASPSGEGGGVVELAHKGLNQNGEVVATFTRKVRLRGRPAASTVDQSNNGEFQR